MMYNIGSYVVYKKDVCIVKDIKKNHLNNKDYYLLVPLEDESLKTLVPIDNRCGFMRELITKEELEQIISDIPNIETIKNDGKNIENDYKTLFSSGSHHDLIKIIKTTYLRNKERIDSKRKIGDKDQNYFEKAEKYLYQEFSIVLGISIDEVKSYIFNRLSIKGNENEE